MSQDETKYIPTKIIPRQAGYINHLKVYQGSIDYNDTWSNEFSEMQQIAEKLIPQTENAIKFKLLNISKKPQLMQPEYVDAMKKVKQMWWDGCWFGVKEDHKEFLFEPKTDGFIRLIKIPPLSNMRPRGKIGDDWGVWIRETMPIRDAFAGHSYDEIVQNAGFAFQSGFNLIPKFAKNEMNSLRIFTYIIAVDNYDRIMHVYNQQFFGKYAPLVSTFHQELIDYMETYDQDVGFEDDSINIQDLRL